MNYLLDTCLLSELHKRQPNKGVLEWVTEAEDTRLYLSVLTLGEIQKGVAKLADGKRKQAIQAWLDDALPLRFHDRILPLDNAVALEWGLLCAAFERKGRPIPVIDGLLTATAIAHNLTVVTRNTKDFSDLPVKSINPWI